MKSKSGIFTNILFLIIGVLLGAFASWIISNHYYTESVEDKKRALIESTIHKIELNLTHKMFEEYHDTAKYRLAGRPFDYLQDGSLKQLYLNLMLFREGDSSIFIDLQEKVVDAKLTVQGFNQHVGYRNSYILINPYEVKGFNPGIFQPYYEYVEPSLRELKEFLIDNKESLVK